MTPGVEVKTPGTAVKDPRVRGHKTGVSSQGLALVQKVCTSYCSEEVLV